MKVRTVDEFLDRLDEDLAWRRRELAALRSEIKSRTGLTQAMLLRSGTALLYAHWEGFVKEACGLYVTFVATKGLKFEQLSSCFVALSLRRLLNEMQSSNSPAPAVEFVEFVRTSMAERAPVPKSDTLVTANLTYTTLCRMLRSVGLETDRYDLKKNLIDLELVGRRNGIAHGRMLTVGVDDFSQLFDDVVSVMVDIRDQLLHHAVDEQYKVPVT